MYPAHPAAHRRYVAADVPADALAALAPARQDLLSAPTTAAATRSAAGARPPHEAHAPTR
eukprot:3765314-Pleurochrysis_carterae.AAC.1